jgi:hypothetical protein
VRYQIMMPVIVSLALSLNATAQAHLKFTDMVSSLNGNKAHVTADLPDGAALVNADTYEQAESIARTQSYEKMLAEDSARTPVDVAQILELAKKKKLTIVVLPGLTGEFNQADDQKRERSFEEIFSASSTEKTKWSLNTASKQMMDEQYDLFSDSNKPQKLSDLMSVASVDDAQGNPLVKIVIMNTKLGSLETIGSVTEKAAIFNRRLEAFMKINSDENIVLLGFSRGTPLALEMLSQARSQNLAYLSRVKAMTAVVGVIMGASIAD